MTPDEYSEMINEANELSVEKPTRAYRRRTHMIYKQISSVMKAVDAIEKDRQNTQGTGYSFRGIDDIYNELHMHLANNGVFTTSEIIAERSEEKKSKTGSTLIYRILTIRFTFFAEDGSFVESEVIGEAMDSGDKASNKAMAVAHKYALMQIFAIPTKDNKDVEEQTHEIAPIGDSNKYRRALSQIYDRKNPAQIELLMDYTKSLNMPTKWQSAKADVAVKFEGKTLWQVIALIYEWYYMNTLPHLLTEELAYVPIEEEINNGLE